ncbi:uncharacterized protein LOC114961236 isoform X2 [Acropora millepora]|uniref:uncharacterized protein LOC114961236 isoform X2 n=1 Tax=Acropora millepora TaxID=45264 RepID=UPI001CF1AE7E|nr:uncharacterized protein LOC114961236 isoform X2 [Acropora millepora]
MAAVRSFWLSNKQESKSRFFKSCIFQQMWREHTLPQTLGLESTTIQQKHLSYVARCLLNSLLNHQFDDALQCMVALCGACLRTPEMFWRTGCEVMSNNTRSYSHLSQFIKNMFVICGPYRTELLLDYAMYLVQYNSDITEANELLTTKLSDKSLQSSVLLKAYAGLFAYLSWKKSKKQLDKKQLDNEEATVYGQDAQNSAASNLKRQMDFHAKQALALFDNSVEHKGNWDIFVTKQVEILDYYNRSEEARKILEQYMEKNPENPNAYRAIAPMQRSCAQSLGVYCRLTQQVTWMKNMLNLEGNRKNNQKVFLMLWHHSSSSLIMLLAKDVRKPGNYLQTLLRCILLQDMTRKAWMSSGTSDLIGGHGFISVLIKFQTGLLPLNLSGSWLNIRLRLQDCFLAKKTHSLKLFKVKTRR